MSKLGILVNTDRHPQHVQGLTRAALAAGHDVLIFVMDAGTRLVSEAEFQGLADLPRVTMTLCDHSAKVNGVAVDRLPAAILCRTQLHNAMMNHQADRVIVL